ncbi:MAG: DNA polymerase I [Clostridia bacterium]|nr:DNA polymerase I [Clostridia bacterium]
MRKLLVLDGNSIINRAFYGVRDLSTKNGMPTNALYGFVNIVKRYADRLKPDYMICAFDTHEPTFRHKMFDEYKGNRKGMPEELVVQMPYAKAIASALGFKVIEAPGYEADDIIGTVCRLGDEAGDVESTVLTGDRDSLQLISDRTHVMLMRNKGDEFFDRDHFFAEYGVGPEQFVDVKALMGDSSDCIPGVPGIGEKTALKLISAAETLDKLYEAEDAGFFGSTPSVVRKLSEGKESAFTSRTLATIFKEVPTVTSLDGLENGGMDKRTLRTLFRELEFEAFITKYDLFCDDEICSDSVKADTELVEITKEEFDNITFVSVPSVSVDGDTAYVCDGEKTYVCGDVGVICALGSVICHDYKKLCKTIGSAGPVPGCEFDTMLAKYLLDPGKSVYLLTTVADSYGITPPENASGEAAVIRACAVKLKDELENAGMTKLLLEVEIPLAKVLAEIELVGFKIDRSGIKDYAKYLFDLENELADKIYMLAGHDFNINSPKQLGTVLFDELGLPSGKKTKTGYATDADTLQKLRFFNPIIPEILSYRKVAKLRGTYGEALADMADENDRIHTSLNQCGTATGRLSSNDPNLQNIPVRDELGRELRKYFIAEDEDHVLIDADYSQIELRLLAHLSGDENMISAFNTGVDIHTITASQVFRVIPEMVTKDLRLRAKAVNFGIIYGIGAFSLAQDIGTSKKQADEYIKNYFETYPKIEGYLKSTVENAEIDGFTTTMFGRRRNIPELKATNKNVAAFGKRVAMNSPIQGTAADIIKIAMINVSRALKEAGIDARLIMQVHDELIVESALSCADEAKEILVREMQTAASLAVPLTAEAGVGRSWLEAK